MLYLDTYLVNKGSNFSMHLDMGHTNQSQVSERPVKCLGELS